MFWRLIFILIPCFEIQAGVPRCITQIADHGSQGSKAPIRLLATSATHQGVFTAAVRDNELFLITDGMEKVGKVVFPTSRLARLRKGGHARWNQITKLAALNRAESIELQHGAIAIVDSEGKAFTTGFPDRSTTEILLEGDAAWALGVSYAETKKGPPFHLYVFSTKGIHKADVVDLEGGVLGAKLVHPIDGLWDGVALGNDDFILHFKNGAMKRLRNGTMQHIGFFRKGIRSMSGYLRANRLKLWVVDQKGQIYEWQGRKNGMRRNRTFLPKGVSAMSVASTGAAMAYHPFVEEWSEGYYSNVRHTRGDMILDRVWFLGNDGQIYSPWSMEKAVGASNDDLWTDNGILENEGKLAPISLLQSLDELDPLWHEFKESLGVLPTSLPVGLWELRSKAKRLAQFSNEMRPALVGTWLRHLKHVRYIETESSGIAKYLAKLGLPSERAFQLVLLDSLSDSAVEAILLQRGTHEAEAEILTAHALLTSPIKEFAQSYSETESPARHLIDNLFARLGWDYEGIIIRFDRYLWLPGAGRPTYEGMVSFIRHVDPFWEPIWEPAHQENP